MDEASGASPRRRTLLDELVLADEFPEFLTLVAYPRLS